VNRKVGAPIFVVYACLSLGAVVSVARAQQRATNSYDGHWWLSVSPPERSGFLNGYFDCYRYEYRGPARFRNNPPAIADRLITKHYQDDRSRLTESVSDVFYRFRDLPGEKTREGGGEPIRGRHGFYDGTYWKQIGALGGKPEQLGFVEGYLWCHAHLSGNEGGIFSKPPADYARMITQWYGITEETGDIDEKREPVKVADVLFKVRDHVAKSNEQAEK
jgi:hypothetical protein